MSSVIDDRDSVLRRAGLTRLREADRVTGAPVR
jgi:hypothetical protein